MRTRKLSVFVLATMVAVLSYHGAAPLWAQTISDGSPGSLDHLTYRMEPGDVITVSVWKSGELGATVPIRPDGLISLPLIGEVRVVGKTPEEVRIELTEAFQEFVTAPSVSVVIEQINSWKVFVLGEVQAPGAYDVLKPMTLMQLIAMAGGTTEFAKKDEIVVLRNDGTTEKRTVVSMKAITSGRETGQNIVLRPGDTVVVP